MTGRIHSYETFGAADGPGVRFVVFMHGCPFRCRYCHNPDTWAGRRWTEATSGEVLARAVRYRPYWGEEGGITVSGGEPMMQAEFVAELFELAHSEGVNTCLDTAAGPFDPASPAQARLFAACDLALLDLKHLDPAAHRALTGADNARVLACARRLADLGVRVWIRHVLVPGVTDAEADLRRLAAFVATLPNVERVDVLPYHSMGVEKWRMLGLEYSLGDVRPPSEGDVARARAILEGRA